MMERINGQIILFRKICKSDRAGAQWLVELTIKLREKVAKRAFELFDITAQESSDLVVGILLVLLSCEAAIELSTPEAKSGIQ